MDQQLAASSFVCDVGTEEAVRAPIYRDNAAGAGGLSVAPPIRVARRASVHAVCVAVYQAHYGDSTGSCVACDQPSPCRTRGQALKVIQAHSDDQLRYDPLIDRARQVAGRASITVVQGRSG